MELIFMGTGTSQGVPMIAYPHHVCDLNNPRNWRTRTSAHVVMGGRHFQIDAGPEFRLQCLWNRVEWIDDFILTHGHSDHLMGMDDLRRFCDLREDHVLPVYSSADGLERIRQSFPYAAREKPLYDGYPAFRMLEMPPRLEVAGGVVESAWLTHGNFQVLGLVFTEKESGRRLAYYTDCKELSPRAWELARGVDVLVLDGLRPMPHPSHFSISEAVAVAQELGARRTYLTHLTHLVDHETVGRELPAGIHLAYDGLRLSLPEI
ncbi:MAG: MBL fold metallo-hydrolase [Candidatus Methylacidiphilales bacterium]